MAMTCNIDRRGRRLRALMGLASLGAALAVALLFPPGTWRLVLAALLALGGAFTLFEALRGWCAVRALGVRTRF